MTLGPAFSLANMVALLGWIALLLSPLQPRLAQAMAAAVPVVLGVAYAGLIARFWGEASGGFGSLDAVSALFSHRGLLLVGWLHYLAFDLLVGAWQVREAGRIGLPHLAVVPALALTFLFGPVGFLVFLAMRAAKQRATSLQLSGETS